MSQQKMTLEQAIVGLLNAVTVAQQRGAFNLQEAATLYQAYNLVQNFHQTTLSRPQTTGTPAAPPGVPAGLQTTGPVPVVPAPAAVMETRAENVD